ncbi:MAG: amino acid permease [Candidatus Aenigmarchaeota archaeon]|nr:amino acid permease [Candidatus Aenigmarchaeota archaeon]
MKLKKSLTFLDLLVYGIGVIVGAGIYVLIGISAGLAGNLIWLSFILASLISIFTGLSYAELSSVFPKEAAEYFYFKNIFKNKFAAFLVGWISLIAQIVGLAAVSIGFANYFSFITHINPLLVSSSLIIFVGVINFLGAKESSNFNFFLTGIAILGLLLIIILSFYSGNIFTINYFETDSLKNVLKAAALIFFAFIGFEGIVNIAEEVKNPTKNVPRALIWSIVITTILYMLIGIASVSTVNYKELSVSQAPLALVASKLLGDYGFYLVSFAALFSTASTVLVLSIVSSRILWGMARDNSLPKIFSKLFSKTQTPFVSIFTITLVSLLLVLLLQKIDIIAEIANFNMLLVYLLVNFSLIYFRLEQKKFGKFKSPLNIGRIPLSAVFGFIVIVLLFTFLSKVSILLGIAGLVLGAVVFYLENYRRKIK